MVEQITPIEDLRQEAERQQAEQQQNALAPQQQGKSIRQFNVDDIHTSLDTTKDLSEQAADVVDVMATAAAVQDEETAEALKERKAAELKARATARATKAQEQVISATTDKEEAQRQRYEAVLQTFCIKTHLPKLLMYVMLVIFSPIYIAISIAIGVPCGIVKVIIDNIDNILVRYENADEKNKPKIKFTVVFLLITAAVVFVAIVLLKYFNINLADIFN